MRHTSRLLIFWLAGFLRDENGVSGKSNMACATTPKIEASPLTPVIKMISVNVTVNLQ
jgi:hypothetical protein